MRAQLRACGRGWLLSGAAFFGSCEEFPNDYTTAPRHREGTFCFSRLVFSPRAQRNPWVVGLGGMEREASAGGVTSGNWSGDGRKGCKPYRSKSKRSMVGTTVRAATNLGLLVIRPQSLSVRLSRVCGRFCVSAARSSACARSLVVTHHRPLAPPL